MTSLRTRLLVGLLAVAAIGLTVASLATNTAMGRFLEDRIDSQLRASRSPVYYELSRGGVFPGTSRTSGRSVILTGTYAELRVPGGPTYRYVPPGQPVPDMPDALPSSSDFLEVSVDGFGYRALSTPLRDGSWLLVALPLGENRATMRRLVAVEVTVGAFVLLALAVLATWVVRIGLRPLDAIGDTASAIAGGDLSRRVAAVDARTEVGRLGAALNVMLARIEDSFDRRAASEERLRRFVADASHELRTPLTSIRGYAELFRRGAAERPEDLANAMRRIESEATRMSGLVEDLLLLARLDHHLGGYPQTPGADSADPADPTDQPPLSRQPVDLLRLAVDAVGDARAVDPARSVTLTGAEQVWVDGDEARLRQVLANLLGNAVTHTPAGTAIHVRVTTEHDGAVHRARLDVRDEGPGLAADTAPRVFERFYRGDPARSRATGGSGLGLSIVAAIAAAHGGSARVEPSPPGGGAWFVVELPAAAGPPRDPGDTGSQQPHSLVREPSQKGTVQ